MVAGGRYPQPGDAALPGAATFTVFMYSAGVVVDIPRYQLLFYAASGRLLFAPFVKRT